MPTDIRVLMGFANCSGFPVSANTASAYTVGAKFALPGAQSLTQADTYEVVKIPGDDGTVKTVRVYKGTQIVLTVAGVTLDTLSNITGATFDEESHELDESEMDVTPEIALTCSGLLDDGGYRLYRYYSCKLSSYKADLTTRPNNNSGSAYQLTFECAGRLCDPKHKIRTETDIAAGAALTWLDTIPSVPVA